MNQESLKYTEVEDSINSFRNLVNDLYRIRDVFISDRKRWYILCSSMDVIGNTEAAISAYTSKASELERGDLYLSIYGLMQSLIVQQDALIHLYEVLELPKPKMEDLSKIRDIRNDCVGHPTKRDRGVTPRSSFLYSLEMTKEKFTLNRAYHDGTRDGFEDLYPLEIIKIQRKIIKVHLDLLVGALGEKENQHREQFKDQLMKELFKGSGYFFEKVLLHLIGAESSPLYLAKASFEGLERILKAFEDELLARGIKDSLPGVTSTLEEIRHPMLRLNEYFVKNVKHDIKDGLSFGRHVKQLFDDIEIMALEIDQNYKKRL